MQRFTGMTSGEDRQLETKNGSHSLLIEIPRVSPSVLIQSEIYTCITLNNARRDDVNQRDMCVRGEVRSRNLYLPSLV